jgi:hypothetical protein
MEKLPRIQGNPEGLLPEFRYEVYYGTPVKIGRKINLGEVALHLLQNMTFTECE